MIIVILSVIFTWGIAITAMGAVSWLEQDSLWKIYPGTIAIVVGILASAIAITLLIGMMHV